MGGRLGRLVCSFRPSIGHVDERLMVVDNSRGCQAGAPAGTRRGDSRHSASAAARLVPSSNPWCAAGSSTATAFRRDCRPLTTGTLDGVNVRRLGGVEGCLKQRAEISSQFDEHVDRIEGRPIIKRRQRWILSRLCIYLPSADGIRPWQALHPTAGHTVAQPGNQICKGGTGRGAASCRSQCVCYGDGNEISIRFLGVDCRGQRLCPRGAGG